MPHVGLGLGIEYLTLASMSASTVWSRLGPQPRWLCLV